MCRTDGFEVQALEKLVRQVAGISWWVQMQRQEDIRSSVPEAVELLLAQGVLERSAAPDGAELYGYSASHTK